jgi:hypothetical protein
MDAHGLLDLIHAEVSMFDLAVERARRASTRTEQLEATTLALDACWGILEHVALLWLEHPEHAEALA